jgi:hypothetical protein
MKTDDVYQFFGSGWKASIAIGVTRQTFSVWIKRGYIPFQQQKKIEKITKGKLIAREEDAKKSIESTKEYLPSFRYYDRKYGMCRVESIHFRKGKAPKITYIIEGNNREKFSVFGSKNLMQAADIVDFYCRPVFEGDILKLKNGDKCIFESLDMVNKLKKLGKFKIIGNIFE